MGKLVCIDLETTDLNPVTSHVLEIGAVVFDADTFAVLDEFETLVRPTPIWALKNLDPVVQKMHDDSLLMDKLTRNIAKVPRRHEAESKLLEFLQKHPETKHTPLVGSNIWFDRSFMRLHLESAEKWFHYRNIDVSSLGEFARSYMSTLYRLTRDETPKTHRALQDARASVATLQRFVKEMKDGIVY